MKLRSKKSYGGGEIDLLATLSRIRHRAIKKKKICRPRATFKTNRRSPSPTNLDGNGGGDSGGFSSPEEAEKEEKRLADRPIQTPPTNLVDDDCFDEICCDEPTPVVSKEASSLKFTDNNKTQSAIPELHFDGTNLTVTWLSSDEAAEKERLAEAQSSTVVGYGDLLRVETGPFGICMVWDESEPRDLVFSSPQEEAETHCKKAIEYLNKKFAPDVYELVEAVSSMPIMVGGVWYHCNLKARRKTADGSDDSSAELYFVEVNALKEEITSFKSLEHIGDAPPLVTSCRFCSPANLPIVYHPGDGDFYLPAKPSLFYPTKRAPRP